MKFWKVLRWLAVVCFAALMVLIVVVATPSTPEPGLRTMPKIYTR
jgi:hypothetical protein